MGRETESRSAGGAQHQPHQRGVGISLDDEDLAEKHYEELTYDERYFVNPTDTPSGRRGGKLRASR